MFASSSRSRTRRSPAVNQGYLCRAVATENSFERAIINLAMTERDYQVLSCGAGFDTAFFRLKNMGIIDATRCRYFEVDFQQVITAKAKAILGNQALTWLCLGDAGRDGISPSYYKCGTSVRLGQYSLIGCDVTDTEDLARKLFSHDFRTDMPTVVFCECSLTYTECRRANLFYRWVAASLTDCHLVVYEQIEPNDRFGKIMKRHFSERSTPLLNVDYFPTLLDQERRLASAGFLGVRAVSLGELMRRHYGESERLRRRRLEPTFDEFEEVYQKCSHYSILEGLTNLSKSPACLRPLTVNDKDVKSSSSCLYRTRPCCDLLWRYGHSSVKVKDTLLIIGGIHLFSGRDNLLITIHMDNLTQPQSTSVLETKFTAYSTSCLWSEEPSAVIYCFGGRASPSESSSALIKIDLDSCGHPTKEEKVICTGDLPSKRWRHTMNKVDRNFVVVGGKNIDQVHDDLYICHVESRTWTKSDTKISKGLHSHAASMWRGHLLISGGLDQDENVVGGIFDFHVALNRLQKLPLQGTLVPRFGHYSAMFGDSLVLVGGVAAHVTQPGVAVIDLPSMLVTEYQLVDLPRSVATYNGSLVREDETTAYVVGGGGNCFSFGMHIGHQSLELALDNISHLKEIQG